MHFRSSDLGHSAHAHLGTAGPGEAREADLGVASGNGKGQIFVRGEVIKTVKEADIVETLIDEAMRLAESMPAGDGAPEVSVR